MLRKIKLYGPLAKFIGKRVLQADVASAAEAVRFLVANFPAVEKHMADQHYRVTVGSEDLTLNQLHDPTGLQHIKIIPVVTGAGGNAGNILLGIGLIAASFLLPGAGIFGTTSVFGVSAAQGGAVLAGLGTAVSAVGASLVLGGVAQLLSPVPTVTQGANSNTDPRKSYSFSGIQQTSRQGTPVPICYGLTLTGSVVISAGIDTVQVKA
jgi:predicted phage tail protein